MRVYRLTRCLVRPLRLWRFSLIILLGLVACRPAKPSATGAAAPTPRATATAIATADAWQTYHSEQGGYTVDYPATWTVDEQAGADGAIVTTFASADSGASITMIVQTTLPDQAGLPQPADILNTRCKQVTVDRLPGIRCFDTTSFSTTTTVTTEKKTYTISTSAKRLDQNIYQHFLDSLRVVMWVR